MELVLVKIHFLQTKWPVCIKNLIGQHTRKYIIYLNNSIVSEFKGFQQIKAAFEKETGYTFGCYDENPLFSLFETSCIGLSDQEPAALINF